MLDRTTPLRPSPIGCAIFALGIAGIGSLNLRYGDFMAGLQPVPAWVPARSALAIVVGAFLVATAAAIATDHGRRPAARALTALLWFWVLAIHLPGVVAAPASGGAWTTAFEMVAIGGAAAGIALPAVPAVARLSFGVALPVFGVLHIVYRGYVASVIPAWIPGHMFWALATGAAHIAAGASLLTGRQARHAAILLAVMFGSWVVILHLPRAIELAGAREWTSLFVATAMCGGSWLLVRPARRT